MNALGNPLIGEKGKVVRVWNGSRFTESLFNPPAGSWYTMSAMAVDPPAGMSMRQETSPSTSQ